MREMIVSELTQAFQELARDFAHFLPRLMVMLIIAFLGWVIASLLKFILRSILRLAKFDKLSENAGASQLLNQAALPSSTELLSRFVFWVAWLGFILLGVSVLGIVGLQEHVSKFFLFLRASGSEFLFPGRPPGGGQCEPARTATAEYFHPHHHHHFRIVNGL